MREQDILYEKDSYWVCKGVKSYEVYRTGATHSTRCATFGGHEAHWLTRAIADADRRAASEKGIFTK